MSYYDETIKQLYIIQKTNTASRDAMPQLAVHYNITTYPKG